MVFSGGPVAMFVPAGTVVTLDNGCWPALEWRSDGSKIESLTRTMTGTKSQARIAGSHWTGNNDMHAASPSRGS